MRLTIFIYILTTLIFRTTYSGVSARSIGVRDQLSQLAALLPRGPDDECLTVYPDHNDNKTFAAYVASYRGVPSFLNSVLVNRIIPQKGNTKNWLEGFYQIFNYKGSAIELPAAPDCQNLGSGNCDPPSKDICDHIPSVFWTLSTISNFHNHMSILHDAFNDAAIKDSFEVKALSDDFPIQTGAPVVNFLGLLNNVAASLGIFGGVLGLAGESVAFSGGVVGVVGGVLGQVASNFQEDDKAPTSSEPALVKRMGSIFSAVTHSTAAFLEAVFIDGDLKNFPGIVLPGPTDYNLSISAFFDNGNFFYGTEHTIVSQEALTANISTGLLQVLTGVALTEANWYVLRNAYSIADCPTDRTGRNIDGTCFTLERAGLGGKLGGADLRGEYSLQMDEETLAKVTSRKVVLEDLYRSSNACQKRTKAYNAQGSMSISNFMSPKVEACFYNLPVLTVTTDGLDDFPYRASPCSVFFANKTATKDKTDPITGATYLPANLEPIFSESGFCKVDKYVGSPGTN